VIAFAFQQPRFCVVVVFFCVIWSIMQSLEFPTAGRRSAAFRIESAILDFGTTDAVLLFQETFSLEESLLNPGIVAGKQIESGSFRQGLQLAQRWCRIWGEFTRGRVLWHYHPALVRLNLEAQA
jgi:hypothetical protein